MTSIETVTVCIKYPGPLMLPIGELEKDIRMRVNDFSQMANVFGQQQTNPLMCGAFTCASVTITFNSAKSNNTESAVFQIICAIQDALKLTNIRIRKQVFYSDGTGRVGISTADGTFMPLFIAQL